MNLALPLCLFSALLLLKTAFALNCNRLRNETQGEFNVNLRTDAASLPITSIRQSLNDAAYKVKKQDYPNAYDTLFAQGPNFFTLERHEFAFSNYLCESGTFRPGFVEAQNQRIDEIQALGAEVLLLMTYNAPCLTGDADNERHAPVDPEEYRIMAETAIHLVTTDRIAAGKKPITMIEGWNEPDLFPIFFVGTRREFVNKIFVPLGQAVQNVQATLDFDLTFFTPATANLYSSIYGGAGNLQWRWIDDMVRAARRNNFELEAIAWHYYGQYPFTGCGENEFSVGPIFDDYLYPLTKATNPNSGGKIYYDQIRKLKRRYPDKKLMITEWNVIGAVNDPRTHTHEGAAFTATVISAMQEAGLDYSNLFVLQPENQLYTLLNDTGAGDQRWHVLQFWNSLGPFQLAADLEEGLNHWRHDVWATVSRQANGDITMLIANYRGMPRYGTFNIDIELENFRAETAVRSQWLDRESDKESIWSEPRFEALTATVSGTSTRLSIQMQSQATVLLDFRKDD